MHTATMRGKLLIASMALELVFRLPAKAPDTTAAATVDQQTIADRMIAAPQLPDGWRLDDISRAVPAPHDEIGRPAGGIVHVLAWKISQDDPAFTVQEALVLKEFSRPGSAPRWVLASGYQHAPRGIWPRFST